MKLTRIPLTFAKAAAFVAEHHRHHTPPVGHKFSIGAVQGHEVVCGASVGILVGVAIVGRPVSRMRDDGRTLEITRLCTDGTPNACSFLYGAAAKACFALGYSRIGTYILKAEPGTSLKAAGWQLIGEVRGREWDCPSRPRLSRNTAQDKMLFELVA